MKKAVIAVGSHYVGKSKTINDHLKPKLGIGKHQHKFLRNEQPGYILSQSFEEAERDVEEVIEKYSFYELLVISARPSDETPSLLQEIISGFSNAGYRVNEVEIVGNMDSSYYDSRAVEMLAYLDN